VSVHFDINHIYFPKYYFHIQVIFSILSRFSSLVKINLLIISITIITIITALQDIFFSQLIFYLSYKYIEFLKQ
jgi:hypothetical protein